MKGMLVIASVCVAGLAQAQKVNEQDVPAAVKSSFANRFAGAKQVKWSKEGSNEFEAEFDMKSMEQSASFDASGKWLETETEIKEAQLPSAVKATIARDFAGYKISEPEKSENADGSVTYEVEAKKGQERFEVQLAADGRVLKKELLKKEKDEKH